MLADIVLSLKYFKRLQDQPWKELYSYLLNFCLIWNESGNFFEYYIQRFISKQRVLHRAGHRGPVGLRACIDYGGWGFKSRCRQISFWSNLFGEVRAEEKKITLSHCIGAVAVGEEEKTRKMEASFEASILSVWRHLTILCNINSCWKLRNIDFRWS